ncbi:RNA-binding S4 domain-containing protein [Pseudoprimorskyibacter insulae]|uniref:Heat shock protein 15 n=1 Tax=Pseudoprimorskyibacter insulae TaxID=1695997 RepID=A0A2R8AR20_9RHOB|nr:RNA-binding S4 domain-containing protein [Pseudoprimorskyibacter insulae]SPF78410.1 Heat shock protein 15 [Pseudoprimorskyibacter insulae]
MSDGVSKLRIDKWLWHARFFKTRSLAAKIVSGGHVRVNGNRIAKPAVTVGPGDVLTFAQANDVRVIRVLALGERRGPAPEARTLYDDLDPPKPREAQPQAPKYEGGGRPTKRERRKLDETRTLPLE